MPGKLSKVNHQIVRMKVRRIINAAFQVFDDLLLRCSRFRKTRGVTVVLIGFHSAGLQLASDAAGLRIQVKIGGLFNMVSRNHYLIHSGLLHRVDRAADLRRGSPRKLPAVPRNPLHSVGEIVVSRCHSIILSLLQRTGGILVQHDSRNVFAERSCGTAALEQQIAVLMIIRNELPSVFCS